MAGARMSIYLSPVSLQSDIAMTFSEAPFFLFQFPVDSDAHGHLTLVASRYLPLNRRKLIGTGRTDHDWHHAVPPNDRRGPTVWQIATFEGWPRLPIRFDGNVRTDANFGFLRPKNPKVHPLWRHVKTYFDAL